MSKSDPASAIFMEDSEAEVRTKIKKAFAAPGEVSWLAARMWPRVQQFRCYWSDMSADASDACAAPCYVCTLPCLKPGYRHKWPSVSAGRWRATRAWRTPRWWSFPGSAS
jgi:tRNA synthetases class I (W and Y)